MMFFFSFISQTLNKVSPVYNKASYLVSSYPENKEKNRTPEILARKFLLTVIRSLSNNDGDGYENVT